jgi:riboflavin biosynthesis pyrimidine reductase
MDNQTLREAVTRLYPLPSQSAPLHGLYLDHRLHTRGNPEQPFVYSNFVTSLDGRIGIESKGRATHKVPDAIANPRDWRLYQELAGQAEVLITSGRFFRQSSVGEEQDLLPVGTQSEFDDIRDWRSQHGLAPQPDIIILSASLAIPLAALEPYRTRRVLVATGEQADPERMRVLEENGIEVLLTGSGTQVEGRLLVERLGSMGYRSLYAIAGPGVFYTLLEAGVLDRLYLTIACQLLGGNIIDTLTSGELLSPAQGMHLIELHHDPHTPEGAGQLFGIFEPAHQ